MTGSRAAEGAAPTAATAQLLTAVEVGQGFG